MAGLIQVVGGAIVDKLGDPEALLVARRSAPEHLAGLWEFPGGKVEPGEAPEAALVRELAEELGIGVRLGAELPAEAPAGWPLNDRASMRVWFAEVASGEPAPLEDHDELRWIRLEDRAAVLGLPWIPADYPIVRALLDSVAALVPQSPAHGRPAGGADF
ncbi:(deoxy)nucleoside triphosphate pyrophosphohydrolase [Pseudarthrobacter sp. NPDC058119]|uniref:(deoxy)nucleoside triphosphate pyrophosphohydrolase n=1 Tax=Pseudarthrobacter sp. NPDC058119 TaxID=3346348 RepID=UPI0036D80C76